MRGVALMDEGTRWEVYYSELLGAYEEDSQRRGSGAHAFLVTPSSPRPARHLPMLSHTRPAHPLVFDCSPLLNTPITRQSSHPMSPTLLYGRLAV